MSSTFQDMLRRRQKAVFVGRGSESLAYRDNLFAPLDDPDRRSIFAVSGQGGMGKSTFLQHCRGIATAAGVSTGYTDESDHDLVRVMERLATELGGDSFKEFLDQTTTYRHIRQKLEGLPDAPPDLTRVITAAVGEIGTKLARRIPLAGVAFDFVDEEKLGRQLGEVVSFVLSKTHKEEEAELLLDPVGTLSPIFVESLSLLLAKSPVAMFFDTFEETSLYVQPWLIELLTGAYGGFPQNLMISIAGRDPLDPNLWSAFDAVIARFEMAPLSRSESKDYLSSQEIVDERQTNAILDLAQGVPLFLAVLAIGDQDGSSATESLIERILRTTPKELRPAALAGATPRVLNKDIGKVVFEEGQAEQAFEWLIGMPFVTPASDGWRYHNVIRREFLKYGRRTSPAAWLKLHTDLAEYYTEAERASDGVGDFAAASSFNTEATYHRLCSNPRQGIRDATAAALHYWNIEPVVARPWAVAIRNAGADSDSLELSLWGDEWSQAIGTALDRDFSVATNLFTKILVDSDLGHVHPDALSCRSDLYRRQGRFDLSLVDAQRARELRPDDPYFCYRQSVVNLDAGNFEAALLDCERAIQLESEPDRLTILRLLRARIIRGLFSAEVALEIVEEVSAAETPGMFFLRGELLRQVGRYDQAVQDLKRAMEMDPGRRHAAWKEVAVALLEAEKVDEAVAAVKQSLEVVPTCGHCWEMLAVILSSERDPSELLGLLEQTFPLTDLSAVRSYRALGLRECGAIEDACSELLLSIEEEPQNPYPRLWSVDALEKADRWEEAAREVNECLKLRPQWPIALRRRAAIRFRDGDFAGANDDWDLVEKSRLAEVPSEHLLNRGLCLSILGRHREAVALFDKILEIGNSPEAAYNRLISIARINRRGISERDRAEVEEALHNADEAVVRLYGLAGIQAVLGSPDVAIGELSGAMSANPEEVRSWASNDPAWIDLRDKDEFKEALEDKAEG
jgi:tetratricopeptide (TPR) repeat protein